MRRPVTGVVRFFHVLILAAACATISDATTWTALDHPGAGLIYTRGYDGSSVGREWHRGDFSAGLLGAVPEPNTCCYSRSWRSRSVSSSAHERRKIANAS
jgi:hypothetical protein